MFLRQLAIVPLASLAGIPLDGMTAGSVLYIESDQSLGQDNANFFWDATNHYLGLGTTTPESRLDVSVASVGVGQTIGLTLQNPTAATVGVQKYSPLLAQTGYGWKTDATAGSQRVDFGWQVRPEQGAAAPTGALWLSSRVNAGSWVDNFGFWSNGYMWALGGYEAEAGFFYTATANTSAWIQGNRDAADTGVDVIVSSLATRTAGSIFDVQRYLDGDPSGTSIFRVGFAGQVTQTLQARTEATTIPNATGVWFNQTAQTYTDGVTAGSGTVTNPFMFNTLQAQTLAASNVSVTYSDVVNLSVFAPVAGTNITMTNSYAIQIRRDGIGTAQLGGISLSNRTASNSGGTTQFSPMLVFEGTGYDNDAGGGGDLDSRRVQYAIQNVSTTGANVYHTMTFRERRETAIGTWTAWATVATLNVSGNWATLGTISAGGALDVPAGTAAAPSVKLGSAATGGFYAPAANTVGITTNGVVKYNIGLSGNTLFTPAALTSTLGTSTVGQWWNTAAATHTLADGAGTLATWYGTAIQAPTITGAGADRIITDVATLFVAAPVVTTITGTNQWAIRSAGKVRVDDIMAYAPNDAAGSPVAPTAPLRFFGYNKSVDDDASITLPAITSNAHGFITVGTDAATYADFVIDSTGTVVMLHNTADVVVNADTDAKLCLGTAATQESLLIKNRLGATKVINLTIWYD